MRITDAAAYVGLTVLTTFCLSACGSHGLDLLRGGSGEPSETGLTPDQEKAKEESWRKIQDAKNHDEQGQPAASPTATPPPILPGDAPNASPQPSPTPGASPSPTPARDEIEAFLNKSELQLTHGRIVRDPQEMEELGLTKGASTGESWTGSGWERYKGATALRYTFSEANRVKNWLMAWAYATATGRSFEEVAAGSSAVNPNKLGAAEKYDLLLQSVGLNEMATPALTAYEWEEGRKLQDDLGDVTHWIGYCHGWASASTHVPRPQKTVTVPVSIAGVMTPIQFNPTDLKALTTALWANALPKTVVLGTRCEQIHPDHDANGRILDPACFDVDPGSFHIAITNQVGNAKRSLLMDGSFDIEIWNQPILSYEYTYFNVVTGKSGSFGDSVIDAADFTNDKFASYRSQQMSQVVGVKMTMHIKHQGPPTAAATDNGAHDDNRIIKYNYDLELDDSGKIVGGEWYQMRHPDFLWSVARDAHAESAQDAALTGTWLPGQPLPDDWITAAREAAKAGQPLSHIVDALIAASRDDGAPISSPPPSGRPSHRHPGRGH